MRTILKLLAFARRHWWLLVLAFLCMIASTAFNLVVPRMLGQGVDSAIKAEEYSALWIAAGFVVGASILRGMADYGNTFFSEVVSQKTAYDIRNALFDRLQSLSFAYFDKSQTGQLMSRATADVEAMRMFIGRGLLSLVEVVLLLVGISYILIATNWQLALITLAFMPIIGWRAASVNRRLHPIWRRVQQLIAALGTTLQENLTGMRVVKVFARQKEESQKFAVDATTLYDHQIYAARQVAINMPMMVVLVSIPTAIVLWFGGSQVIAGNLTIGQITYFILYLGILVMPIRRLGMMIVMAARFMAAGQRIMEILDTQSEVIEKPGAIQLDGVKGAVSFENVSFSYDSTVPTLEDISFSVEPGQLVALLGGSGSGKSTIANLLTRFYDVTGGRITVDGTDIRDVTLASLRKNIVTAQQDIFLFSATIRDNIAYGATGASMEEVEAVAKAAHLHDFVQSLPDGYETWTGERGLTLSGGERQRLAIARTLLINPNVLVLDDSTSSVDAETEQLIRQALDKLIKGRTTFIITHRLPIIKTADLILMLKDGRIVERGKHDDLMALKGIYYQTYQSQLAADQNSEEDETEE